MVPDRPQPLLLYPERPDRPPDLQDFRSPAYDPFLDHIDRHLPLSPEPFRIQIIGGGPDHPQYECDEGCAGELAGPAKDQPAGQTGTADLICDSLPCHPPALSSTEEIPRE